MFTKKLDAHTLVDTYEHVLAYDSNPRYTNYSVGMYLRTTILSSYSEMNDVSYIVLKVSKATGRKTKFVFKSLNGAVEKFNDLAKRY